MDRLGRVFGLEEEELSDDDMGRIVIDGAIDANDSFFEKPGEYIVGSLSSRGVLYDHRDQTVGATGGVGWVGPQGGSGPGRSGGEEFGAGNETSHGGVVFTGGETERER